MLAPPASYGECLRNIVLSQPHRAWVTPVRFEQVSLPPGKEALAEHGVATIRELAPTEVGRSAPGLGIFGCKLKLPPGHGPRFTAEWWRHGKREKSGIHLGSRLHRSSGRVDMRLREGETMSPAGEVTLRWDWRFDDTGGR